MKNRQLKMLRNAAMKVRLPPPPPPYSGFIRIGIACCFVIIECD